MRSCLRETGQAARPPPATAQQNTGSAVRFKISDAVTIWSGCHQRRLLGIMPCVSGVAAAGVAPLLRVRPTAAMRPPHRSLRASMRAAAGPSLADVRITELVGSMAVQTVETPTTVSLEAPKVGSSERNTHLSPPPVTKRPDSELSLGRLVCRHRRCLEW
jgi:hypothetical protein